MLHIDRGRRRAPERLRRLPNRLRDQGTARVRPSPDTISAEADVTELIEQHQAALAELCRRFGVDRLYVFGSAASGDLRPASDVDLVVSMADRLPTGTYADRFLDFAEAVESLLGRRVDLVSEQAIRNPFFRREIEATRQLVYGQPLEKTAV